LALDQEFLKTGAPESSYFQTADVLTNAGIGWLTNVAMLLTFGIGALREEGPKSLPKTLPVQRHARGIDHKSGHNPSQGESKMLQRGSIILSKKLYILTIGGGVVFWVTTIVISLLPIAAEYRAAYSNWRIQTVWVDSLLVGVIIGGCVSYSFLRLFEKIPTKNPILESAILGFGALVMATLLIDVPRSFLLPGPSDAWHYFLIGIMLNAPRFLFLGLGIGYLYKRLYESA
jgi:hypothetical protein